MVSSSGLQYFFPSLYYSKLERRFENWRGNGTGQNAEYAKQKTKTTSLKDLQVHSNLEKRNHEGVGEGEEEGKADGDEDGKVGDGNDWNEVLDNNLEVAYPLDDSKGTRKKRKTKPKTIYSSDLEEHPLLPLDRSNIDFANHGLSNEMKMIFLLFVVLRTQTIRFYSYHPSYHLSHAGCSFCNDLGGCRFEGLLRCRTQSS